MGFFADIINDAKRASPVQVFAGSAGGTPEATAPLTDRTATAAPEAMQEAQPTPAATLSVPMAEPAISGIAASEQPAFPEYRIFPETSQLPAPGSTTVAPLEAAGQYAAVGGPVEAERPPPARQVDTDIVSPIPVKSGVMMPPPVADQPVEAVGGELPRPATPVPDTIPPSPAGLDLPHGSEPHVSMKKATGRVVAQSAYFAVPAQDLAGARRETLKSPDTVTPPREMAGAGAGSPAVAAFERPTPAEQFPSSHVHEDPEPVVPSPQHALDRDAPSAVEARIWPREHAAQSKIIEPRVHIGRVDIVILAPEAPRQAPAAATTSSDLASRLYLRRL
jgi:hypothetical protein